MWKIILNEDAILIFWLGNIDYNIWKNENILVSGCIVIKYFFYFLIPSTMLNYPAILNFQDKNLYESPIFTQSKLKKKSDK
jgi:hypothetical protein